MLIFGESIQNDSGGENPLTQISIQNYTQEAGAEFDLAIQMTDS